MSSTPFFIPDTSPLFNWAPCDVCGEVGGWQSAYSSTGDGTDQTFHQTSNADSSVAFNISGRLLYPDCGG